MKRLIKKKCGRLFAIWTLTNGRRTKCQHDRDNRNVGHSAYPWRYLGSTLASNKTTVMSRTIDGDEIRQRIKRLDGFSLS